MRNLIYAVALTAALGALSTAGFYSGTKIQTTEKGKANMSQQKLKHTIEFHSDKMYEFAALWVKPGKMDQLNQYFGEVFPIAVQKYGIRPVISLIPQKSYRGDFEPTIFFINEWPSREVFNRFVNDPEVARRIPVRDDALDHMINTHTRVNQPVKVELKEGEIVEFASFWIQAGADQKLNEYYSKVFPIAAERYGVRPVAGFTPIGAYKGHFVPSRIGLNAWPNPEAFQAFVNDPDARKLFPLRDEALADLVVLHSLAHFEGEGK